MDKDLLDYVQSQKSFGKSDHEIESELRSAGWTDADIKVAMTDPAPQIMTSPEALENPVTPVTFVFKPAIPVVEIFTKFFSFKLLALFAISLGTLYFQVINHYFPDPLSKISGSGYYGYSYYYGSHATRIIHYAMAAVLVSLPLYLVLLWRWIGLFDRTPNKPESRITKWATHIVIIMAAAVMAGDFVGLIYNFLEGEFASRIILKGLIVAVIAGAVIVFYVFERLKIEYLKPVPRYLFWAPVMVLTGLAVIGVVLGFASAGSPGEERARKFDTQRASDLRQLASGIEYFARENKKLPSDLEELKNDTRTSYYARSIKDPETEKEYEYRVISDNLNNYLGKAVYELCADFSLSSEEILSASGSDYYGSYYDDDIWVTHEKGRSCDQKDVSIGYSGVVTPPAYNYGGNGGAFSASLADAQKKSRDARRITDIKQLQLALELYFDENNASYPQTAGWEAALVNAGVIPSAPKDPSSNSSYVYQACNQNIDNYCLAAGLEDTANAALASDLDAPPAGCTCPTADPVYAVSP